MSDSPLQPVRRVVTGHTKEGKAIIWKDESKVSRIRECGYDISKATQTSEWILSRLLTACTSVSGFQRTSEEEGYSSLKHRSTDFSLPWTTDNAVYDLNDERDLASRYEGVSAIAAKAQLKHLFYFAATTTLNWQLPKAK